MVHDYVLKDFSKAEMQWVDRLCDEIGHHIALLAEGRDAQFQNKIHLSMDAAGFGEPKKKTDLEKKSNEEKKPNEAKSPAK
jgi:PTH1 family peptidyl-tRNA hydrolase